MNTKKIHQNNVQFDYFSENFLRFEEDFYHYSIMTIPLTFMTDDILHSMSEAQVNYFTLPAHKAKDRQDHYFIFRVKTQSKNKQMRTYEYVGHRL